MDPRGGHGEQNEWLQLEFEEEHYIGKVGLDFWTNPADTAMDTADRITVEYSLDGGNMVPGRKPEYQRQRGNL